MCDYDYIVSHFPTVPQSAIDEIKDKVMPHYIFYQKKNYSITAYCTHCKKDFGYSREQQSFDDNTDKFYKEAIHNNMGQCPLCQHNIKFKSENMRRKTLSDYREVNIIIKRDYNHIYVRGYYVYQNLEDYKTYQIKFSESARYYISTDESYFWKPINYWRYTTDTENYTGSWEKRKTIFEWSINSYLIDTYVLKNSFLKYSLLDKYIDICASAYPGDPFEYADASKPITYLSEYSQFPALEYLIKLGFDELVFERINKKRKSRHLNLKANKLTDIFKMDKQRVNEIIDYKYDINADILDLLFLCKKNRLDTTVCQIVKLLNNTHGAISKIKFIIKQTSLSITKINNYLNKKGNDIFIWHDYLNDCVKLSYDMTNLGVIKPTNLYEAHQKTIDLVKYEQNKQFDKQILNRQKKLKKYIYSTDDYSIVLPATSLDIISEGAKLNHCVGGYVERHAGGKTNILFIRKNDSIDTPFFTIEVDNKGVVIQIKGYKNYLPTGKLELFVDEWKKAVGVSDKKIMKVG